MNYLYLLYFPKYNIFKIGVSSDPYRRMSQIRIWEDKKFKTKNCFFVSLLADKDKNKLFKLEKELLKTVQPLKKQILSNGNTEGYTFNANIDNPWSQQELLNFMPEYVVNYPKISRKVNTWTWEECLLLKKYYNTMPLSQLIEEYFPKRTPKSITGKVYSLRRKGWRFAKNKS